MWRHLLHYIYNIDIKVRILDVLQNARRTWWLSFARMTLTTAMEVV